jgi:hypothetical protein
MKSFALALSALLLAACGSPIVGAECRDGFTNCDGECVDLSNDPDHCGACEDSCGAFSCEDSECTTKPRPNGDGDGDGDGEGDGDGDGDSGSGGRDAGESPIGTGNPFEPDAGFNFPDPDAGGCPIGSIVCDGECANTETDHEHCGVCGIPCARDQFCALGVCVDACEDPLDLCGDACVDYRNDPFHCGGCGNACQSGICEAGKCADTVAGQVIVIGHDYRMSDAPMQRRLAVNALFTLGRSPVRALLYGGDSSGVFVSGLRAAIDRGLQGDSRTWVEGTASPNNLTALLLKTDVLLIAPQDKASDARLKRFGQEWSVALIQFIARGGVIVLFDTQTDRNAGTFQLLEPSGLFEADGRMGLMTPVRLNVELPIGVASGGTSTYFGSQGTVSFQNVTSDGFVNVRSPAGDPVVIQRIISP